MRAADPLQKQRVTRRHDASVVAEAGQWSILNDALHESYIISPKYSVIAKVNGHCSANHVLVSWIESEPPEELVGAMLPDFMYRDEEEQRSEALNVLDARDCLRSLAKEVWCCEPASSGVSSSVRASAPEGSVGGSTRDALSRAALQLPLLTARTHAGGWQRRGETHAAYGRLCDAVRQAPRAGASLLAADVRDRVIGHVIGQLTAVAKHMHMAPAAAAAATM